MCPSKKRALKRLIDLKKPDIIFLQETLGNGSNISFLLESMFGGCTKTIQGTYRGIPFQFHKGHKLLEH